MSKNINTTVAVLGCGIIGFSWAKAFLNASLNVKVWDPNDSIEKEIILLNEKHKKVTITFHRNIKDAVKDVFFIQESAPELLKIKHDIYTKISPYINNNTILASSTSTIKASTLQKDIPFAERIIIGHPFNPPHLLPLVEVVAGKETSCSCIEESMQFYKDLGKKPILLKTERLGHLANRLQAAVWREAVDAVASGQASTQDVDLAITQALGPRWAIMGPF